MIGKLQYVVPTRPDIASTVGKVVRVSKNTREKHMMVVTRIMIYLKGTKDYSL